MHMNLRRTHMNLRRMHMNSLRFSSNNLVNVGLLGGCSKNVSLCQVVLVNSVRWVILFYFPRSVLRMAPRDPWCAREEAALALAPMPPDPTRISMKATASIFILRLLMLVSQKFSRYLLNTAKFKEDSLFFCVSCGAQHRHQHHHHHQQQ